MRKITLAFLAFFLILVGCSKDSIEYAETKRVSYIFSPGGKDSKLYFRSNKDGDYIALYRSTLYTYQDEVRPGDRLVVTMATTEELKGNFDIRIIMDDKTIFSSNKVLDTYPKSIVIDEILDKALFKK